MSFAPTYTRVAAGAGNDNAIASGNPIEVYGIFCSNTDTGSQTVTIERYGTSTIILTIEVPASGSVEVQTKWVADYGIQVSVGANTACTIFHNPAGT